jgi:hypothetical protein
MWHEGSYRSSKRRSLAKQATLLFPKRRLPSLSHPADSVICPRSITGLIRRQLALSLMLVRLRPALRLPPAIPLEPSRAVFLETLHHKITSILEISF